MAARQSPMSAKADAANLREFRKLYHPRPEAEVKKPHKPSASERWALERSRVKYLVIKHGVAKAREIYDMRAGMLA